MLEDSDRAIGRARFGPLDDGDPVGTGGHRGSRHDLNRRSRLDNLGGSRPGREHANDRELHGRSVRVVRTYGIAVHCRVGERRQIIRSVHVLGKDEAEGIAEPDVNRAERHARAEHDPLNMFEGDQFLTTVSVHDDPPWRFQLWSHDILGTR